jgi:hypothetical protein
LPQWQFGSNFAAISSIVVATAWFLAAWGSTSRNFDGLDRCRPPFLTKGAEVVDSKPFVETATAKDKVSCNFEQLSTEPAG